MLSLPPYLIFFIFVLVIIPSIATIFFRIALYRYLTDSANKVQVLIKGGIRGKQPEIVKKLEQRFNEDSGKLEQMNTGALIDQIYSQQKVKGFTCEQIDHFCQILPNLLLAFGLLGTFSGITINLSGLSQTINQTNASDVASLVTELKQPLAGMSIAFTTSLTGLLFSALLTVFNFLFNAGLAKYRLISSLEDYLDNIYFPKIQGNSRLDKIVNKMVSQQDEFLTRFGDTVREAVEKSMGNVAKQIADGNVETTNLARQVYERFAEASGVISGAANEFKNSMSDLNSTSQVFRQSADIFSQSQFPEQLSLATGDLSNTQQKFSESAASLATTTELIQTVLIEVQNCSQNLINLANDIRHINQTSIEILGLHQSNQNLLGEIIPQLEQGANSYQKAVNKLDDLDKRVEGRVNSLDQLITVMNHLSENAKEYTTKMNSAITSGYNQIDENNQNNQTLLITVLQDNNSQLISEYQNLIQGINKQTDINIKGFKRVIDHLQECNRNIYDTKSYISRLKQVVE